MTKQERADEYFLQLTEEGFAPRIDGDGDVAFKFEGGNYVILLLEDDEDYFRLAFPGFWPIKTEEDRVKVLRAAAFANAGTKVAKIYPVDDDTWASAEMFVSAPESMRHLRRSLSALQTAVRNFCTKMEE